MGSQVAKIPCDLLVIHLLHRTHIDCQTVPEPLKLLQSLGRTIEKVIGVLVIKLILFLGFAHERMTACGIQYLQIETLEKQCLAQIDKGDRNTGEDLFQDRSKKTKPIANDYCGKALLRSWRKVPPNGGQCMNLAEQVVTQVVTSPGNS